MTATFTTYTAALLWARTYGLNYPFTITQNGALYVVRFDTREPYGMLINNHETADAVMAEALASLLMAPVPPWPKTQKARGVQYLIKRGEEVPLTTFWFGNWTPAHPLYPAFARPCPITPRHGFVESRLVNSHEEALAVLAEARAADPDAELMIAEPINAASSAVLTPRAAAIGAGHDGATSGRPGVVTVGLTYTRIPSPTGLVPSGQVPYIELVRGQTGTVYFTQLRSGPNLSAASGDWVPADVIVSNVLDAHAMSPLELEAALETAPEGTVVWQSEGSPCSHAACHARLNNCAIVFGAQPSIGQRLHKTADVTALAADAFARAVRHYGAARELSPFGRDSTIWAIHQAIDLAASDAGARFVARACVAIWRYAASACIAEARHSRYDERGRFRRRRASRSTSYARTLGLPASHVTLRKRTAVSLVLFDEGEWSPGYGGNAWHGCAKAAFRLYDALTAVSAKNGATEANVRAVIAAAHGTVNAAHNNGPFLNKFFDSKVFDDASQGSMDLAAQGIFEIYQEACTPMIEATALPARRKHTKAQKPEPTLPEILESVQWCYRSNGTALHVQYGSRGKYISATIPLTLLSDEQRAALRLISDSASGSVTSLAGSTVAYWPAISATYGHVLSAATVRILFPNLRFTE